MEGPQLAEGDVFIQQRSIPLGRDRQTPQVEVGCLRSDGTMEHFDHQVELSPVAPHLRLFLQSLKESRQIDDGLLIALAQQVRGLRFLDLACGSDQRRISHDAFPRHDGEFPPYFCRALHAAGADVTGVDIRYPSYDADGRGRAEGWKFHQVDLTVPSALDFLSPNAFDVVTANFFLGHTDGGYTSPMLGFGLSLELPRYLSLENQIFAAVLRLLRPGGVFILNSRSLYPKSAGPLRFTFLDPEPKFSRRGFVPEGFEFWDPSFLRQRVATF